MKYFLHILFVFFFVSQAAFTQGKGTISGKVTDKKTKEGLISVNISIKGTYYGTTSDLDGNFKVLGINAGNYTLQVTLLGYKPVVLTGIIVEAGKDLKLDLELEETSLTLNQEVVVIGEKPLFNIEETSNRHISKGEDLQKAAIQRVEDAVALQVGVTQTDGEIHIRGGRSYENAYLVNGVSVQDPLSGAGFGLQVGSEAIEEVEVLTGGYNAEFGQATSGIVNIKTKEGSSKFTGGVSYKRDHFGFNDKTRSNFNTDIFSANVSGPLGPLSFFVSINTSFSDDYTRWVTDVLHGRDIGYKVSAPNGLNSTIFYGTRYAPRGNNALSLFGTFTYKPTVTTKLSYSLSQSVSINQDTKTVQATLERVDPSPGFQYSFQRIPDSAETFTSVNTLNSLTFTNTISTQTFYELQLSFHTSHVRGDNNGIDKNKDGVVNWKDYTQAQDIVTFPIDTFRTSPETLRVIPGDGFYDLGSPSGWRDSYIEEISLKADITHNFSEQNKMKAGFDTKFGNIQYVDIVSPFIQPLGYDNDKFQVSPTSGALYAQNSTTISGMILNAGLRMDYWFPGKYVDDATGSLTNPFIAPVIRQNYFDDTYQGFDFAWNKGFSAGNRRWKARLSPRIAVSHPISDNQTLTFSYGHFSKLPRPQFVYSKLTSTSARSSSQTIGNPDLNPETTVAYELVMKYQIDQNDVLSFTAYYKDIFDYITPVTLPIRQGRIRGNYQTYINLDYARTRGLEAEYIKRLGRWFSGTFSGSYSISTGKSSNSTDQLFNVNQGLKNTVAENYLNFDRPLQFTANLNFTINKGNPLFGMNGVLEDINTYVKIFYQSGKRYIPWVFEGIDSVSYRTPRRIYHQDLAGVYTALGDPWFYVDMNIEKNIEMGFAKLVVSFEIQNVLNNKNAQIINPVTGNAYEYGDDVPTSGFNDPRYPNYQNPSTFPYNPARYLNPRTFRLGMSVRF